jgi:aarF domain-containing kinase
MQHADLHPGNIMLAAMAKNAGHFDTSGHDMDVLVPKEHPKYNPELEKKQEEACYRVTLVDAGMVAQLTEEESSTFIGFFSAMGEGDGKLAAKFALGFSKENQSLSSDEREAFVKDMADLFDKQCRGYGTDVEVGEVLRGILSLIRKHRVRIDANYATLVVNALCVESMAQKVCPDYNVLDAAEPLLRSYFKCFFEPDGSPKNRKQAHAKFVRAMPGMYLRKSRNDNKFFRQQRRIRNANNGKEEGGSVLSNLKRKLIS